MPKAKLSPALPGMAQAESEIRTLPPCRQQAAVIHPLMGREHCAVFPKGKQCINEGKAAENALQAFGKHALRRSVGECIFIRRACKFAGLMAVSQEYWKMRLAEKALPYCAAFPI